ncbi:hypothetical protein [Scytonema sp. PRP1]|uniref:hypothetical protein n=1 Tax=Scytonema sp. PRP1 TaxID=3120513 RepID=UPI002FD6BDB6
MSKVNSSLGTVVHRVVPSDFRQTRAIAPVTGVHSKVGRSLYTPRIATLKLASQSTKFFKSQVFRLAPKNSSYKNK